MVRLFWICEIVFGLALLLSACSSAQSQGICIWGTPTTIPGPVTVSGTLQCTSLGVGVTPSGTSGIATIGAQLRVDLIGDESYTVAPTFSYGWQTAAGYGGSIGGTAPTTNALELAHCGTAGSHAAPTNSIVLATNGTIDILYFRDDTPSAADISSGTDYSTAIVTHSLRADTYYTNTAVLWGAAVNDGSGSAATMTFSTSPVIPPGTLPTSPATGELVSDSGANNAAKMWDGSAWDILSN